MEQDQSDNSRRTFIKGAATAGVAATGVTAFGGNAAAQDVNLRNLQVDVRDVQASQGLITVQLQNVRIIRDIRDIDVTVIGRSVVEGDLIVTVLENVDITFEDRVINIENIDVNVLTDFDTIQVAVAVLGDALNIAQGSDSATVD